MEWVIEITTTFKQHPTWTHVVYDEVPIIIQQLLILDY